MFETSQSTEKIDIALAKAQSKISSAVRDSVNPHYKSKYADLASIWNACRSALTENGISVTQWPIHSEDGRLHLVTRLAHAGEWMRGTFSIPAAKQDAQSFGSAITYIKRFSLAAAVGIAPDDDDGEAAMGRAKEKANNLQAKVEPKDVVEAPPVTDDPGAYVVTFGKHKGKKLSQVDRLADYVAWVEDNANKTKKPIDGQMKELIENAKAFLKV